MALSTIRRRLRQRQRWSQPGLPKRRSRRVGL